MVTVADRAKFFRQFIIRSVGFPFIAVSIFALILAARIVIMRQAAIEVERADAFIAQANYTERLAIDAETGQRGYLVGLDKVYLQPYNSALRNINTAFDVLDQDGIRTPDQVRRVDAIRAQYLTWLANAQREMGLAEREPSSFRQAFNNAEGKMMMDGIRSKFESLINVEAELRDARQEREDKATYETLWLCGILGVALAAVMAYVTTSGSSSFASQYEQALVSNQKDRELLSATLFGIGDAVLVTDTRGRITMMNKIAEELTGWTAEEANGVEAKVVFNILNETTRSVVQSPIDRVLAEGIIVGLANHTVLQRRDGSEIPIDDSGAPIRDDQGELVGVVLIFRDVSERKLVERTAAAAYEREHRIAENLQRSLLEPPSQSLHPRLKIETFYEPAWNEAKVGGDFYDVFSLTQNKVAMVVGDVSGKGLKAASRTAELKFALRGFLHQNLRLTDVVNRFNDFVCHLQTSCDDDDRYFLCLTVVVVDQNTGEMSICVSGCDPPIVMKSDGTLVHIEAGGTPFGVKQNENYECCDAVLDKDEVLLLASDGLTEARGDADFLGIEGLGNLLVNASPNSSLSEVGKKIVEDARKFGNGYFRDDVCLLLARRD